MAVGQTLTFIHPKTRMHRGGDHHRATRKDRMTLDRYHWTVVELPRLCPLECPSHLRLLLQSPFTSAVVSSSASWSS